MNVEILHSILNHVFFHSEQYFFVLEIFHDKLCDRPAFSCDNPELSIFHSILFTSLYYSDKRMHWILNERFDFIHFFFWNSIEVWLDVRGWLSLTSRPVEELLIKTKLRMLPCSNNGKHRQWSCSRRSIDPT